MNKKRPSAGFFDHQDRQAKLIKLNNVLIRLKAQVDWDGSDRWWKKPSRYGIHAKVGSRPTTA